jgi:hypothetical protein
MMPNVGAARRLERATQRVDAAMAALVPEYQPVRVTSRQFTEVLRAEHLADTLERLVAGEDIPAEGGNLPEPEPGLFLAAEDAARVEAAVGAGPGGLPADPDALTKRLAAVKVVDLKPLAEGLGIDIEDMKKDAVVAAIVTKATTPPEGEGERDAGSEQDGPDGEEVDPEAEDAEGEQDAPEGEVAAPDGEGEA